MTFQHPNNTVAILFASLLFLFHPLSCALDNGTRKCPIPCQCLHKQVNCSNRALEELPVQPFPDDIQVLLLGSNNLRRLTASTTTLIDLHTLDLHLNRLTALPNLSFVPVVSILLLNKNSISSLNGLQEAVGLKELSLNDNKIMELDPQWFKGLVNLEFLYLDKNHIKSIPNSCFMDLKHLKTLTLSYNILSDIHSPVFNGLANLAYLFLNNNNFSKVPGEALATLSDIKTITLSGNPVRKFSQGSFKYIASKELELTKLPHLFSVDKESFVKLKRLLILHLHHNPKLTYMDPKAFSYCTLLHSLYLHNNNLLALDIAIPTSLPSLQTLSLYHNHLHCDCNVHWIREALSPNASTSFNVTLQHPERLVCDTPLSMNARLLESISLSEIPTTCSPTVIPFFNDSHQRELGDSITYECRSIGVPAPHIHWLLSDGKPVNNTSNDSRIRLDGIGTLTVNYIKAIDSGTYTCVATNSIGCDTTSTVLRVHNSHINIMHTGVATNFVTLTWNGTGSTVSSSSYVILYKELSPAIDMYEKIALRPYMRQYTITNLKPHTMYEFCIAYEHRDKAVKLNCMHMETKDRLFLMEGIKTVNSFTIVVALSIAIGLAAIICGLSVLIRRYNRRKQYDEADGINTANKKGCPATTVGHMSQIPLDNLYKLNSTQLCSSTTSLISSTTTANSNA